MAPQRLFNGESRKQKDGKHTMHPARNTNPASGTMKFLMALIASALLLQPALIFANANLNETLRIAVLERDIDGIKAAVAAGADPNYMADGRPSPLELATTANDASVVSTLIEIGANPNEINRRGVPTIFSVFFHDNLDILEIYLNGGLDKKITDTDKKWTPLVSATSFSSIDMIQALLQRGADPNHRGENGFFPISGLRGNRNCDINCYKLLIDWGASPFHYGQEEEGEPMLLIRDREVIDEVVKYYEKKRKESKK